MAVAIAQTANPAGVSTSSGVATYSGVGTGTASPDRVIVVAIAKEVATVVPTGVTIDGNAMTLINGTTFGNQGAWLYRRSWPLGTTADIAVTWDGAATNVQNHIAVYAVTDAKFPVLSSGVNTSTDMDSTVPLTTGSITIPANGGFLAVVSGQIDTVAKTWANATEDLDADVGDFRFTTAFRTSGGTVTVTCTGGSNGEDGAMAYMIVEQQEIPTVVTPAGAAI
jgi:hypothetical protein